VADTDVPGIPENLHMVIVYKAMEYYGLFESAGEVLQRARVGFSSLRGQLEREQLPSVYLGNPLA
jgi:mannitol/fructose-specific phosphotransferase system IIA component